VRCMAWCSCVGNLLQLYCANTPYDWRVLLQESVCAAWPGAAVLVICCNSTVPTHPMIGVCCCRSVYALHGLPVPMHRHLECKSFMATPVKITVRYG
jgi:hypothetical protein